MDEYTVNKLDEWGLSSYIEVFKANRIGSVAFQLLSHENIKSLIPALGDQIIFVTHHSQLKDQNANFVFVNLPHGSDLPKDAPLNNDIEIEATSSTSQSEEILSPDIVAIRSVIASTGLGTTLLQLPRRLRDRERRQISDIVINNFLKDDPKLSITKSQFLIWAGALSSIFKKDPSLLWYTPLHKSSDQTFPASGALLRAYYSFRKDCAQIRDEESSEEEDEDAIAGHNKLILEASADINWLENHLEPWDVVLEKWVATREARKIERAAKSYSITDYIKKYKVIRQPNGYMLLFIDFEYEYPDSSNKLFNGLDAFVSMLFEELKHQRPISRELKRLLAESDLSVKSGGKLNILLILLNLMHLVPAQTVQKQHKCKSTSAVIKGWRPTKQEVQNGFITLIDDVSKLLETVERRDQRLQAVKLTRQPFVILVGKDLENIEFSYVAINDFYYLLDSPSEALDACFKTFFALNASYSIESRPLWMLLQTVLYGIKTKDDKRQATLSTVSLLSRFNVVLD